ncbi:MAG TPA: hypothetical protein VG847_09900 [Chitinophagaceae bacterium]|nr:hypothetical protein [Chitinophagaceae bacterium]
MKFFVSILLTMLLGFAACLFFPWWSIAVVAFIVAALIRQAPLSSFFTGFIALFLLWGVLSFWISAGNNDILAHRVSLLIFKNDNPFLLIVITALTGAIVAGFAALTASYIKPAGLNNHSKQNPTATG